MATQAEVKVILTIDSQGNAKIQEVVGGIEKVDQAAKTAGDGYGRWAGHINNAGASLLNVVGVTLSIAGAAYLAEKAFSTWYSWVSSGVSAMDDYRKSIISASAMLAGLTDTKSEPDLGKAYGQWKEYFAWLWKEAIEADKKVAASQREIYEVGQELAKRGVVATTAEQVEIAGRLTDFMKQVAPMTAGGEGSARNIMQIRQEIRDLLEGNVRMNAQTAVQFKQMDENFSENIKKARALGTVYEYLNTLLVGQKLATKDMANTWDSVSASLRSTWQQVQIRAFGTAYDDVVKFGQELMATLIEGGALTQRGEKLADAFGLAWGRAKDNVAKLLDYIIDDGPKAIKHVEMLAGAVGTIGGAAATSLIGISNLLTELKELANNPIVQMAMGAAAGSRFGPFGAALGAVPGGAKYLSGAGDFGFGAMLPDRPKAPPEDFSGYETPLLGQLYRKPAPAPETPPVRPFKPEDAAGGKGGKGADQMLTLMDNLNREIANLSQGSIAAIDAWYQKTLNDIEKLVGKGADGAEAEALAYQAAGLKKEKVADDFTRLVAKEAGNAYAELDARYNDDFKKYQGLTGAKEALDGMWYKRKADLDDKFAKETLGLEKGYLDALAGAAPLITEQLALKEKSLAIETQINRAALEKKLRELEVNDVISAGQADEMRGLAALTEQAKKFALEREKWATQGIAGGVHIAAFDRSKEAETRSARATVEALRGMENAAADALGRGLIAAFKHEKGALDKIGEGMATSFVMGTAKLFTARLFDPIYKVMDKVVDRVFGKAFEKTIGKAFEWVSDKIFGGVVDTLAHEATAALGAAGGKVAAEAPQILATNANTAALIANTAAIMGETAVEAVSTVAQEAGTVADVALTAATWADAAAEWANALSPLHSGGIIAHQGLIVAHGGIDLASNERLIKAKVGEWIINDRAASELAAQGVPFAMLNRGQVPFMAGAPGGGGGSTVVHQDNRTYVTAPFTATQPVTGRTFDRWRRKIHDGWEFEQHRRGIR